MAIIQSCLKKFQFTNIINCVTAELAFPQVVIFENKTIVRIFDVTKTNENNAENVQIFDKEISNYIIDRYYLWLVLISGEIFVINLLKNSMMEAKCNSYANYKIHRFISIQSKIIFISESGERLFVPFYDKILEEFNKGSQAIMICFEKYPLCNNDYYDLITFENETTMYIDDGKLVFKCNTTGLCDIISADTKLQFIVQWNDMNVISYDMNMWVLHQNFDLVHKFQSTEYCYYPLAEKNGIFYFVTWKNDEIEIHNASISTCNNLHDIGLMSHTKENNHSSQEALRLQLKSLVDDTISSNILPDQVLPQLQKLFNDIEDFSLLIDTATQLCSYNILYKVILYPLKKRIFNIDEQNLMTHICDTLIKTDLLEYICFRGGSSYDCLKIFEMDFVQLCIAFISKSDLDLASICWLKYSKIEQTPSTDDVTNMLSAIPLNIKMGALVIWFRNFVPPLLDRNPFFIDIFVKWTTERVFLLEQSTYWPKIGLKFISAMVEIIETSLITICIRPISIDDLDVIKDHINYILELKENYKINMLLSEFSSQSPSEIALIMLRRCYTEDLGGFLQQSLLSYASRHSLDIDDTLRSFIESEAAAGGGNIDGQRLEILLSHFQNPSNKLECLLNILKLLDVPWNPIVLTIATAAAALTHTDFTITDNDRILAHEIYKELNYAKIKVILKKYNFPLTCTDYVSVIHKLINNSTVDLEDLQIVTTVLTNFATYANTLYIDKCLRNCETMLALEYLKSLSNRNQHIVIKTIQNKFEQIILSAATNPLLERNYIDFLKGCMLLDGIQINHIENLYYLKNSYNIKLNLNDIYSFRNRKKELEILKESQQLVSSSGQGRCISLLMSKGMYQQSKLISLLRRTSSSRNVKILIESLMFDDNIIRTNEKSNLSDYKDGLNSYVLLEACNTLSEILTYCDEEHLHYLLKHLSMLNALLNASVTLKNLSVAWKFQYIFLPMSSINGLNDLIKYYTSPIQAVESNISETLLKSDFIPLRIFANLIYNALNTEITLSENVYGIKDQIAKRLVTKVIASQDLDQILVTCLLLTLKTTDIVEDKMWILELLRGQSETLPHSAMHYLSSPLIRRTFDLEQILPGSSLSYPPHYILKTKFNINLSEIALPEHTEETWDTKVLLFYILRHYPYTPYERLVDLCQTLNISPNDGFTLLIISLLTNWEIKYKIIENDLGKRELITENNISRLTSQCSIIWQSIDDKEFIKDVFNDFWNNGEVVIHGCHISINPYYYEVYLIIYHLMLSSPSESKTLKEYYLLQFLKGYQRKSIPKQYEFELFSVKGIFPEIGHYRLPFHLFMRDDMWSNLKSEITLETYESWLPVVALLSLDGDLQTAKDMICSNAVKQTMTSRKKYEGTDESKENEPWRLSSREEPLLRTAHRCVRYIANMEWAGACLFYVLQGCTRGADQVAAAQLCYQFSQRWATIQPGNRAVRQMERLHCTLSTRHVLHKINWACEELMRLSTEPAQLIHAMYFHSEFINKITRYDINRAANEIADNNNVNISSIRIQILENILDKTQKENKSLPGLDTKELITAKYILKATCSKMGAIYLSRIAFDEESDHNKRKKLRALQCLMSVVEPDTAIKVSNRERDILWTSLLELLYIVNLEKIDMPWIIATFMQNKVQALNQLLQQGCENNTETLKIVAELANRFGTVQIIRQTLPLLLRTSLIEDMIPLLLKIHHTPDNIIYSAWRAVIISPFQRADYPITDRQKAQCLRVLNLLPVCPIIKDEDLLEIWKNCVRCKCLGLGCLLLPYMTPKTRQSLGELQKIDKRNLIISLKNLYSESYLVSGAIFVLDNLTTKTYR